LDVNDVWKLRAWDHGLVPTEEDAEEEVPSEMGTLYAMPTIDAYVSAVIELYDIQVSRPYYIYKIRFLK
jgi:hypothetical protein